MVKPAFSARQLLQYSFHRQLHCNEHLGLIRYPSKQYRFFQNTLKISKCSYLLQVVRILRKKVYVFWRRCCRSRFSKFSLSYCEIADLILAISDISFIWDRRSHFSNFWRHYNEIADLILALFIWYTANKCQLKTKFTESYLSLINKMIILI